MFLKFVTVAFLGLLSVTAGLELVMLGKSSLGRASNSSAARCPSGYMIKSCRLAIGSVFHTEGGIKYTVVERRCRVKSRDAQTEVVVEVVCTPNESQRNPCGGGVITPLVYFTDNGRVPSLNCSSGYDMVSCSYSTKGDKQISDSALSLVNSTGSVEFTNNTCYLPCSEGGSGSPCRISVSCQLNKESYAEANCPGCASKECPDGQDCVVSEGQVTCKLRQTGCDHNTQCGDYGICLVVGSSDFTCGCMEGYRYQELPQTCVHNITHWTYVEGTSTEQQDVPSIATCPEGLSIMRCATYGVPTSSSGAIIDDEGTCRALHARSPVYNHHKIQAIAFCNENSRVRDPCNFNSNLSHVVYDMIKDNSPYITCPAGYAMDSCSFQSPWADSAKLGSEVNSLGLVDVLNNSCSVPECIKDKEDKDRFCRLSAVCVKKVGTEYIEEVCPTCDLMTCGEGYECLEGNNSLPQCQKIVPGACDDVEKCGEGDCVVLSNNTYTCQCYQGYTFDGVTCVDVDECEESPCVNGNCSNIEGGYKCDCWEGYTFQNTTCVDVDECVQSKPCEEDEICSNIAGGFVCDCKKGFVRDEAGNCDCLKGYIEVNGECVDYNECEENSTCGVNEICTNTKGSYKCDCNECYAYGVAGVCNVTSYKIYTDEKLWEDARLFCEEKGLQLAKIQSVEENEEFVKECNRTWGGERKKKRFDNDNWLWIGATDNETSGTFVFTDWEELQFAAPWGRNQPDNKFIKNYGTQDYAAVSKWGEWDDSYGKVWKRAFACSC